MKKLAIMSAYLSRGGAERVTIYLSKYMHDRGIDTTIITEGRWEKEYQPLHGVERISLSDHVHSKNKVIGFVAKIRALRTYIEKNNIDTVLIMGMPICIVGILGCLGTRAKVVVSERNDPAHFNGKIIVKYISRFLMKKADGYVFQTEDAKKFYEKSLAGNGVVIPNPLLLDNLPKRYEGEREKIIVTAGRLVPQKNQKLLIDAFEKIEKNYSEYKLVIYGEGPLEQELKEYVVNKHLEKKVFFPGNVTNLLERINSATVFVMTSDFEGMPNALIEAMAIGLPCISTDCPCGGPRELINDGENGVLVPVNNKEELVNALEKILENEEFALDIGNSAKDIKRRLSMQNIGEIWYEYLGS